MEKNNYSNILFAVSLLIFFFTGSKLFLTGQYLYSYTKARNKSDLFKFTFLTTCMLFGFFSSLFYLFMFSVYYLILNTALVKELYPELNKLIGSDVVKHNKLTKFKNFFINKFKNAKESKYCKNVTSLINYKPCQIMLTNVDKQVGNLIESVYSFVLPANMKISEMDDSGIPTMTLEEFMKQSGSMHKDLQPEEKALMDFIKMAANLTVD